LGGTLVDGKGVGIGGATVIFTPAGGGTPIKMITAVSGGAGPGAGNFYFSGTIATVVGATMSATACEVSPNPTPMVATLATGGGGCNNCHATPQPANGAPPIHIP
jgi:hypothetical protein